MQRIRCDVPAGLANTGYSTTLRCEHMVGDDAIDLQINGEVGSWWDGITSNAIAKVLSRNRGKQVNVTINSPGGYALEGIAIYNLLCDHDGKIITTVMGDASSAASHILMAGDIRRMKDNSSFLIHRCLAGVIGNAGFMRAIADDMDLVDRSISRVYAGRTGKKAEYWLEKMRGPKDKDGTTYGPEEALAEGLIDEIIKTGRTPAQEKNVTSDLQRFNERDAWARAMRVRILDIENDDAKM